MKEHAWSTIPIAAAFAVYAGLLLLLRLAWGDVGVAVELGLLAVLLAAVLLLFKRVVNGMSGRVDGLIAEVEASRQRSQKMQRDFEEMIEKRVYELQIINGTLNREIGERIQAEEEVRELQKRFRLILDSAGEGILGLDNQGRVMFINTAASLMLGWEAEELTGSTHHQLIHHTRPDGSPHPEEECPIHMAYRDGLVHYRSDDVFWCKNGSSFPVEYVSTPIRDRGMLTGAVVVFRDMNTFT